MINGGYSNLSKQKAQKEIEQLKEKKQQEKHIRKQKIKHLSNQTKYLCRKIEEKKQINENEEEKRRQRILKMRKIKFDSATKRFQRTTDKKAINVKNNNIESASNCLKDGTYNIGDHVIEIRNGVRVSSEKLENVDIEKAKKIKSVNNIVNDTKIGNSKNITINFRASLYEPTLYLNSHLENLDKNLHYKNEENLFEPQHADHKRNYVMDNKERNDQASPSDSCSTDSLENDHEPHEGQKLLRSSIKSSTKLSDTFSSRRVTFSDSIEFNDGDTKPIFTQPLQIPLYKCMGIDNSEKNTDISSLAITDDAVTTEQILDQLRQDALLPKYPKNEDFSYPDSIVIKQNVAVVSPLVTTDVKHKEHTEELEGSYDVLHLSNEKNSLENVESVDLLENIDRNELPEQSNYITTLNNDTFNNDHVTSSVRDPTIKHETVKEEHDDGQLNNDKVSHVASHHSLKTLCKSKKTISTNTQIETIDLYNHEEEKKSLSSTKCAVKQNMDVFSRESNIYKNNESHKQNNAHSLGDFTHNSSLNKQLQYSSKIYHSGQDYDKWESKKLKQCVEPNEDDFLKHLEQSMASITFENQPKDSEIVINKNDGIQVKNKAEKCSVKSPKENILAECTEVMENDNPENRKIISAPKDGSSIPVRVHNAKIRRSRIIVSAESKKRRKQPNAFTPHPPAQNKSKHPERSPSNMYPLQATGNMKGKHSTKLSFPRKQNSGKDISKMSTKKLISQTSNSEKNTIKKKNVNSPKSSHMLVTCDLYRPSSPTTLLGTPLKDQNIVHLSKTCNNTRSNKSKISSNTTQVPVSLKPIALDKTPTDDEINELWENVRDCLSDDVPEHAYSDTVCVVQSSRQHPPCSASGSFHRMTNGGNVRSHPGRVLSAGNSTMNRRFGSEEILFHRQNSLDSANSSSSGSKRQALLPYRVSRVMSPQIYGNTNKTKQSILVSNNKKNEEKTDVSESMAAFLALEELCTQQSLSPCQAEAVFKASKSLMRKQTPDLSNTTQGISAISLEERRIIESLERINRKLKEAEKKTTPR